MTTVFAVIGEHAHDPAQLLLLGEDGPHDRDDLAHEATVPVEPVDGWIVDLDAPTLDEVANGG